VMHLEFCAFKSGSPSIIIYICVLRAIANNSVDD